MRQSALDRLNLAVDVMYRAYRGEPITAIAKAMRISRQRVYRILDRAEKAGNQKVVKSVEKRIGDEMRKEDQAYGIGDS